MCLRDAERSQNGFNGSPFKLENYEYGGHKGRGMGEVVLTASSLF
jgi:hypothetical protein